MPTSSPGSRPRASHRRGLHVVGLPRVDQLLEELLARAGLEQRRAAGPRRPGGRPERRPAPASASARVSPLGTRAAPGLRHEQHLERARVARRRRDLRPGRGGWRRPRGDTVERTALLRASGEPLRPRAARHQSARGSRAPATARTARRRALGRGGPDQRGARRPPQEGRAAGGLRPMTRRSAGTRAAFRYADARAGDALSAATCTQSSSRSRRSRSLLHGSRGGGVDAARGWQKLEADLRALVLREAEHLRARAQATWRAEARRGAGRSRARPPRRRRGPRARGRRRAARGPRGSRGRGGGPGLRALGEEALEQRGRVLAARAPRAAAVRCAATSGSRGPEPATSSSSEAEPRRGRAPWPAPPRSRAAA